MAPTRKDDGEKENQSIHAIVENIIEQIVPNLIERILEQTKPRTQAADDGIGKKAGQFLKIVGNFDGLKDGYDYFCTAEAMFITMNVQEEEKTSYICCTLVASAARWLLNNEDYRKLSWQEFRRLFERQFCSRNTGQTDLMRFMKLKKNGSMEDHINKCSELRRGIPKEIPERELILIFIQTLEDDEQAVLATMDPASLEDAFQKALKFNTFRPKKNSNSCLAAKADMYPGVNPNWSRPQHSLSWTRGSHRADRTTATQQPDWLTSVRCHNCGRRGHLASECRTQPQSRWNAHPPRIKCYPQNGPIPRRENYGQRVFHQKRDTHGLRSQCEPQVPTQSIDPQDFQDQPH